MSYSNSVIWRGCLRAEKPTQVGHGWEYRGILIMRAKNDFETSSHSKLGFRMFDTLTEALDAVDEYFLKNS